MKVIELKKEKILRNPVLAICNRIENHEDNILKISRSVCRDKIKIKHLINAVQVLIWTNIISWMTILGIIFALFNHSHNIGSLI